MSIALLKKVQQNLGYPVLQKINSTTQKTKALKEKTIEEKFS